MIERGAPVRERQKVVEQFWKDGILNTASNVQFGEGGAGTFSDGKLNTLVKDKFGRNRFVLETFVKFGSPGRNFMGKQASYRNRYFNRSGRKNARRNYPTRWGIPFFIRR